MKHTVTNGPYGLIRIGDIYFNSNGIFDLKGKKIGTKKAKKIIELKDLDYGEKLGWTTSHTNTPHKLGPTNKGNGMAEQQRWKNLPSQLEKARVG